MTKDNQGILSKQLYEDYSTSQSNWEREGLTNKDYYDNLQFTPKQLEVIQEKGYFGGAVNMILPTTEMAVSELVKQNPRWTATGFNDGDVEEALHISKLFEHIWTFSNGNFKVKQSVYDAYIAGRGVLSVNHDKYADNMRGELVLESLDPLKVYPDPNSKHFLWEDAAHILYADTITEAQLRQKEPEMAQWIGLNPAPLGDSRELLQTSERRQQTKINGAYAPDPRPNKKDKRYTYILRYTKVNLKQHMFYELPNQESIKCISDDLIQGGMFDMESFRSTYLSQEAVIIRDATAPEAPTYVLEPSEVIYYKDAISVSKPTEDPNTFIFERQPDPETGQQPPNLYLTMTTKSELVGVCIEEEEIISPCIYWNISMDGGTFKDGFINTTDYPIVPIHFRHSRNPYPKSDISYVRPVQDVINNTIMRYLANMAQFNNITVMAERGSIDREDIERNSGSAGTKLIEYNPISSDGKPPTILPPPELQEPIRFIEFQKQVIQDILGVYLYMQGSNQSAPDGYRSLLSLQENSQGRLAEKRENLEASLDKLASVVMQWIPLVYKERKVLALLDTTINDAGINSVSDKQYSVVVKTKSMLSSNRMAKAEMYKDLSLMLLQAGNPLGGLLVEEMLKNMDVEGLPNMLENANVINQMQGRMKELESKLQEVMGDNQTMQRELVNSRINAEVESAKHQMARVTDKMQLTQTLQEKTAAMINEQYKNQLKQESK